MAKGAKSDAKATAAGFPLLDRMDELVEGLRKHVPAALADFDADAIHAARVSTRRLGAALDLLDPVLAEDTRRPFARVLKKLRRRLGPLRDLDVMIGHAGQCAKNPRHAAAAQWLGECLTRRREGDREKTSRKAPTRRMLAKMGAWWGLREEVDEAREAVPSLLAESLHLQLDAFAERAGRMAPPAPHSRATKASPLQAAVDASPPAPAPAADPHELRIAGKALRYTLEMAAAEGHDLPADVAKAFKKMQEALGLWHDFVVLADTAVAAALEEGLSVKNAALYGGVLELARSVHQQSAKEMNRFTAAWAKRGDALAATIRAAVPLTAVTVRSPPPAPDGEAAGGAQAVSGSQTGPGHSGSAAPGGQAGPPPDESSAA